jgi:Fe2+ or Zn2+ uptake regulation protein
MKKKVQELKDENNGSLPSYAFPGGYPLFYVDVENNVLCPDCANKEDYSAEVIAYDINYENPDLYCDDCGKTIESAYGED